MANNLHDGWMESVSRVMERGDLGRIPPGGREIIVQTHTKLCKLRDEVTGRTPDGAIALLRSESRGDQAGPSDYLYAYVLMLRGYCYEDSWQMANMLRRQYPGFDPRMATLLGKEGLLEELGPMFGKLISNTLVDPSCQPILHAILFADDKDYGRKEVELGCIKSVFRCEYNAYKIGPPFGSWLQVGVSPISTELAASHYYSATGRILPNKVHISVHPWNMSCP